MSACPHITGHRSPAHGALCSAIRRAQEHRHVHVEGSDGFRLLVRAYDAEITADLPRIANATRELDAFTAAAEHVLDAGRPAPARRRAA